MPPASTPAGGILPASPRPDALPGAWKTPEALGRLCRMWDAGDTTTAIGRALGVSKNSVISAARTLDLHRPSPIRRGNKTAGVKARTRKLAAVGHPGERSLPASADTLPPLASVVAAAVPPSTPASLRAAEGCCFPLGTPGQRDFRYCGAPRKPGKPYCVGCCAIAYVRVRDRREDWVAA